MTRFNKVLSNTADQPSGEKTPLRLIEPVPRTNGLETSPESVARFDKISSKLAGTSEILVRFHRGGIFEPDGRSEIFKFLFNYFNHSYHIPTRKKRKWQILNAGIGRPPPVSRWRHFDNTKTTPVSLINLFIDKSLYLLWKGSWLLEKRVSPVSISFIF